jgi:hypothetical protein
VMSGFREALDNVVHARDLASILLGDLPRLGPDALKSWPIRTRWPKTQDIAGERVWSSLQGQHAPRSWGHVALEPATPETLCRSSPVTHASDSSPPACLVCAHERKTQDHRQRNGVEAQETFSTRTATRRSTRLEMIPQLLFSDIESDDEDDDERPSETWLSWSAT